VNRCSWQSGYALLAAVLITALAALFAAAAAAAVGAVLDVQASDSAARAAAAAADDALQQACAGLCRRPDRLPWSASGTAAPSGVRWTFTCTSVPQAEATAGVQADIVAVAWSAAARRRVHAVVELAPAPGAQGLVVAHDVTVEAPLTVSGGGLYSGGSVSGRESITFADPHAVASAPPADRVRGDLWPVAAVHALGGIWYLGTEVHEDATFTGPDTDVHTGSGDVGTLTEPPSPAEETLLLETADARLAPDATGRVDISGLPAMPASGAAALVAVLEDRGSPVTVVGERAPAACPLVLLLEGDVTLGADDAPVKLSGAVLGLRSVTVSGPVTVDGHLWASALTVAAPLVVTTPADWRRRPLPGLVVPLLLALGR